MFPQRIDTQDDLCNFSPVGAFGVGIEKAQISDGVTFIVAGKGSGRWGDIVHRRVQGRRLHQGSSAIRFPKR
jgi:hypothetical protein